MLGLGFDQYGHTDIQETDTDTDANTPFQNWYQTITDTSIDTDNRYFPILSRYIGYYTDTDN